MARQGRLDPSEIEQLRTVYVSAREYSEEVGPDDEGFQTLTQTETRLAEAFKISQPMVRRIVLGLSYPDAPGPIDIARRARAKEVLDETPPTAVRITINKPGQAPQSFVHPPGTTVLVEPIVDDPSKYNASGRPVDKTTPAKPAAQARKTPKKRPSQMTNAEHKKHREEVARREAEHGIPDSASPSRGGSSAWMLRGE